MEGKIRDTEIVCGHCKKHKLAVVRGSETKEMLSCKGCGQYYYLVGGIRCTCWLENDEALWGVIEQELPDRGLRSEVLERILNLREKMWLK